MRCGLPTAVSIGTLLENINVDIEYTANSKYGGIVSYGGDGIVSIEREGRDLHVVVLGNEKGGSGKSTTAMHLLAALMSRDVRVAAIDLDARQRSLTRYLENRRAFSEASGADLTMPTCIEVAPSSADSLKAAHTEEETRFAQALSEAGEDNDVAVIDCPGSDTNLARLAHASASTLITPLNDSFVDLDLLAQVDRDSFKVRGPSLYAEMVWQARKRRAASSGGEIDWIVMRNRLSPTRAHNKMRVEAALTELAPRIGFRFVPGLSERVIYRELFPKGLTLVDLRLPAVRTRTGAMTMSHVTARQELRRLVDSLVLPETRVAIPAAAE